MIQAYDHPPQPGQMLCRIEEIEDPGSTRIDFGAYGAHLRLLLVRLGDRVHGYADDCPHAHHPLDFHFGKVFAPDRQFLQCSSHGARFRPEDGVCINGPCLGKALTRIALTLVAGEVRLAA
ncbi:MAG: Rieske 2Fe-2S domain-containing protein [Alphaproteobacteria bacterium]|nr:Rieske 2Fe-2S domain-containing protein [Alphaproteobacteria bacterium]